MKEYKIHPLCEAVPPMSKDEYSALLADMKEFGFRKTNPIIVKDGFILDGRHRYKAATHLKIEPETIEEESDWDSAIDVIVAQSNRRNLSTGQRAVAASNMANMVASDNQHSKRGRPNSVLGISKDIACKKWSVGRQSVTDYRKLFKEAPDIAERVAKNLYLDNSYSINKGINHLRERLDSDRLKAKRDKEKYTPPKKEEPEESLYEFEKRRKRERAEEASRAGASAPKLPMTLSDAKEILGIDPISEETLKVIFGYYSKKYHQDTGKNHNAVKFDECKKARDLIRKINNI